MKKLTHVRNAIYGQPWAITEPWLETICEIYEAKVADGNFEAAANYQQPDKSGLYEVVNGVAILPVTGPLLPHANLMSKLSGATSYDYLSLCLSDAVERMDVSAILHLGDSPGGSVKGCFEYASEIYAARITSNKPILGHIQGQSSSAAYLLMSQCDKVTCTEASLVGSIGVVSKLTNTDRAEKNLGNDSVVLRSTELKAPGAGGPITPNQIQSSQKNVMKYYEMFVDAVKRGRPGINMQKVSTGEEWIGDDAVKLGLCDDICTLDDILKEYGALD